jgi:hypothetical protein
MARKIASEQLIRIAMKLTLHEIGDLSSKIAYLREFVCKFD